MSVPKCFPVGIPKVNLDEFFPELPTRFPPVQLCQYETNQEKNNRIFLRNERILADPHSTSNNVNCPQENHSDYSNIDLTKFTNMNTNINRESQSRNEMQRNINNQQPQQPFNNLGRVSEGNQEGKSAHSCNGEYYHLTGHGDKQRGYSTNIDVDSELKRINHFGDKCNFNDYKIDPRDPSTKLHKHQDVIVKDYKSLESGSYIQPQWNYEKCFNYAEAPIEERGFKQCKRIDPNDPYKNVSYDFSNDHLIGYPCQKVWNNHTKRYSLGGQYASQDLGKGECLNTEPINRKHMTV